MQKSAIRRVFTEIFSQYFGAFKRIAQLLVLVGAPWVSSWLIATPVHAQSTHLTLNTTAAHQDRDPPRKGSYSVSHDVDESRQRLNINSATAEQLEELLPGIGPAKAGRIIEWRAVYGPFQVIEQLLEVSGIGPKTLERIRPYLIVGEAVATSTRRAVASVKEQQVVLAVQSIVATAQRDAREVGEANR